MVAISEPLVLCHCWTNVKSLVLIGERSGAAIGRPSSGPAPSTGKRHASRDPEKSAASVLTS